jgi:hypothetical protein
MEIQFTFQKKLLSQIRLKNYLDTLNSFIILVSDFTQQTNIFYRAFNYL